MKLEENFPRCGSVFFTLSERPTSRSHSPMFKPKLRQNIRRDRLFRDTWKHFCGTSIFQICDQLLIKSNIWRGDSGSPLSFSIALGRNFFCKEKCTLITSTVSDDTIKTLKVTGRTL